MTAPLAAGAPMVRFDLPDQAHRRVTSGSLQGSWYLLYWYPKANTVGCTAQAQGLQAQLDVFADHGCVVLGASFDSVDDLVAFRDGQGLTFDLLSDADRSSARAMGVAGPDGDASHAARVAFLVDPDGVVARRYDVEDPAFFAELVLDDLDGLSSGIRDEG